MRHRQTNVMPNLFRHLFIDSDLRRNDGVFSKNDGDLEILLNLFKILTFVFFADFNAADFSTDCLR